MGADEVHEFLTFLAVKRNASMTTHRVALSKQASQRAFEPMVSSRQILTLARVTEFFPTTPITCSRLFRPILDVLFEELILKRHVLDRASGDVVE